MSEPYLPHSWCAHCDAEIHWYADGKVWFGPGYSTTCAGGTTRHRHADTELAPEEYCAADGNHAIDRFSQHCYCGKRVAVERTILMALGSHDPTGADHLADATRLAEENDALREKLRPPRYAHEVVDRAETLLDQMPVNASTRALRHLLGQARDVLLSDNRTVPIPDWAPHKPGTGIPSGARVTSKAGLAGEILGIAHPCKYHDDDHVYTVLWDGASDNEICGTSIDQVLLPTPDLDTLPFIEIPCPGRGRPHHIHLQFPGAPA